MHVFIPTPPLYHRCPLQVEYARAKDLAHASVLDVVKGQELDSNGQPIPQAAAPSYADSSSSGGAGVEGQVNVARKMEMELQVRLNARRLQTRYQICHAQRPKTHTITPHSTTPHSTPHHTPPHNPTPYPPRARREPGAGLPAHERDERDRGV